MLHGSADDAACISLLYRFVFLIVEHSPVFSEPASIVAVNSENVMPVEEVSENGTSLSDIGMNLL